MKKVCHEIVLFFCRKKMGQKIGIFFFLLIMGIAMPHVSRGEGDSDSDFENSTSQTIRGDRERDYHHRHDETVDRSQAFTTPEPSATSQETLGTRTSSDAELTLPSGDADHQSKKNKLDSDFKECDLKFDEKGPIKDFSIYMIASSTTPSATYEEFLKPSSQSNESI